MELQAAMEPPCGNPQGRFCEQAKAGPGAWYASGCVGMRLLARVGPSDNLFGGCVILTISRMGNLVSLTKKAANPLPNSRDKALLEVDVVIGKTGSIGNLAKAWIIKK